MGLKLTVKKEDNLMYYTFVDAYWKIDEIIFSNEQGNTYVSYHLNAYPSREASKMHMAQIAYSGEIHVGGTPSVAYTTIIRHFEDAHYANEIFTNGTIPMTEAEQKDAIYAFIKRFTGLPFEDVFEEEQ